MASDPNLEKDEHEEGVGDTINLAPETLRTLSGLLDQADHYLRSAKQIISQTSLKSRIQQIGPASVESNHGGVQRVVEGVFDGEGMLGRDGHQYPVPPNYASKSKLVPGDVLKLTIASDGSFIFKQIGPIERQKLIGVLEDDGGEYSVVTAQKRYRVLTASVTYFHAKPGDQLTIVVPKETESEWAAVENLVK